MNRALLIVAHGSRRKESNIEVIQLAARIRRKNQSFSDVNAAFLELAKPSISDAILNCVSNNVKEVVVFPYFLASGRHVFKDIPEIISSEKVKYPEINIKLLKYFGSHIELPDILSSMCENNI